MIVQTRTVPLAALRFDPRYQVRSRGLDHAYLQTLLQSDPATWPPLLVWARDGDGTFVILDGHHRYAAAQRLKLSSVPCAITATGSRADAFAANRANGKPLSVADRKAHARWLHGEHPDWSLRQIGRECGLSHHSVKNALAPSPPRSRPERRRCCCTSPEDETASRMARWPHYQRAAVYLFYAEQAGEGRDPAARERAFATLLQHITPAAAQPRVARALVEWGQAAVRAAAAFLAEKGVAR